jgi:hypothetical protein
MENLPFYGNISMEIGTLGKFLRMNGNMPRGGGRKVKIFKNCGGQGARVRSC